MFSRTRSAAAVLLVCVLLAVAAGLPTRTLTTREDGCGGMGDSCAGSGSGDGDDNGDDDGSLPTVVIIVIAIGGGVLVVALLLGLCVCTCFLLRRRRRRTGSKKLLPADGTLSVDGTMEKAAKLNSVPTGQAVTQRIAQLSDMGQPALQTGSPDSGNPLYLHSFEASTARPRPPQTKETVRESGHPEMEASSKPQRTQSYVQMISAGTIRDNLGQTLHTSTVPHSKSMGDLDAEGMIYSEVTDDPGPLGRLQRSSSFTDQRPAAISEPVDLKKARQPPRTPPPSLSSTYKPPRPQVAQKPVWLSQKRKPIARAEEEKEEGKKEEVDEGGVDDYVDPQVFLDDFSRTLETYINKDVIEEHLTATRNSDQIEHLRPASQGSRSPSRGSRSPQSTTPTHLKGASLLAAIAAQGRGDEAADDYQTVDEFIGEDKPEDNYENIEDGVAYLHGDYDSVDDAQRALLLAAKEAAESGKARSESQASDNMYVYMEHQPADGTDVWSKLRSQSEKAKWGYEALEYDEGEEVVDKDGTPLYVNTRRQKQRSATGPAKVVTATEKASKPIMEEITIPSGRGTAGTSGGSTNRTDRQDRLKQNGVHVEGRQEHTSTGATVNGSATDEEGRPLYINVEREGIEEADEPEELYQNVVDRENVWLDGY